MKLFLSLLFLGLAVAGAQDNIPGGGKAEPAVPPAPPVEMSPPDWHIHWEFHVITLSTKLAHPLLPELRDETTVAAGWGKVQALIKKQEAKVSTFSPAAR